jgi:serine/threonine protein kinase
LILELCDGTLADYIQGNARQFTVQSDEMNWLYQMACGVEHIHQNKLVHRDIKPQNVLMSIDQDQRAVLKISDFGFCKPTSERGTYSQSGVKGTFEYMAPEVLKYCTKRDEQITERGTIASDVFSLGCVFFNLVVKGLHPFGEDFFIVPNIINGNAVHMGNLIYSQNINVC